MAKNHEEDLDKELVKDLKTGFEDYEEERPKIQLNRKMRSWHKYKKYVISVVVLLVIIVAAVVVLNISNGNNVKKDEESATKPMPTIAMDESTESFSEKETESETQKEAETTTAAPIAGTTFDVAGPVVVEDFTSADKYTGAVFVGDAFVSGVGYYKYVPEAQVISDLSMSCENISKYVDKVTALKPSSIYLMVGLNDLNFGTKTPEQIATEIGDTVSKFKTALPTADVYVLSVLPVTAAFEAKTTVEVTQKGVDELNAALSKNSSATSYKYIDCATVFKAPSTGYFSTDYTTSGYNIKQEYYPFILNSIAKIS